MVEVGVTRLGLDSENNSYVVVLRELTGRRVLPIWIGQPEAEAIVLHINEVHRERPLTHDLCKALIVSLGGVLRRVEISKVIKSTYYAELHVETAEGVLVVDARPSDSIAIALRMDAPLFVAEELLTDLDETAGEAGGSHGSGAADAAASPPTPARWPTPHGEMTPEELKAYLLQLRPEDFGKFRP